MTSIGIGRRSSSSKIPNHVEPSVTPVYAGPGGPERSKRQRIAWLGVSQGWKLFRLLL